MGPIPQSVKGHVPTPAPLAESMVRKLFDVRRPRKGDVLLDPGCGNGVFLQAVLKICKTRGLATPRLIGVELDPGLAKEARAKLDRSAKVIEGDFLSIHLPAADFVVGNPPYVSLPDLSVAERDRYRATFETARGRFDLYSLFFERSLRLLKAEGALVFVTPEKYQYVESANGLRRQLVRRGVREIEFVDEDSFPGRVAYPVVTTVAKSRSHTKVIARDGTARRVSLPDDGTSWNGAINGLRHARPGFIPLESVCDRISCGVATGCDDVFVSKREELPRELLAYSRPTLSGRQLLRGVESDEVMLCPYDGSGRLIQENRAPNLVAYLDGFRERLVARTCVSGGRAWYQFHDSFPARDLSRPKILCKDIAAEPRFWVDESGVIVPRHSVYYIVPRSDVSITRLEAYLNGPDAKKWLAAHCQRAANGYLRLQSRVLQKLPVPPSLSLR